MAPFNSSRDYFAILEIAPSATESEIKKAFHRLSLVHHPDKNRGSEGSTAKFQLLSEAYGVLLDKKLRALWTAARAVFSSSKNLPGKAASKVSKPAIAKKPFPSEPWTSPAAGQQFGAKPTPKFASDNSFGSSSFSHTPFSSFQKPKFSFPEATSTPPPPERSFKSAFKPPTPPKLSTRSAASSSQPSPPPSPTMATAAAAKKAAEAKKKEAEEEIAALRVKMAPWERTIEEAGAEIEAADAAMKASEERRREREMKERSAGEMKDEEKQEEEKPRARAQPAPVHPDDEDDAEEKTVRKSMSAIKPMVGTFKDGKFVEQKAKSAGVVKKRKPEERESPFLRNIKRHF